jgi:hypothetical protein
MGAAEIGETASKSDRAKKIPFAPVEETAAAENSSRTAAHLVKKRVEKMDGNGS